MATSNMTLASTMTLDRVLAQFRDDARNNRDLGDRFERLMQQFFRVDPLYAGLFSEVWMWNEWPLKGQVGDVGIDLVAQEKATGEYCGIQCKFYLPEQTLGKESPFGRRQNTTGKYWRRAARSALFPRSQAPLPCIHRRPPPNHMFNPGARVYAG